MAIDRLKPVGDVEFILDHVNGRQERIYVRNAVLHAGRVALAQALANGPANTYPFYITNMVFGDGGTDNGTPKVVSTDRTGLFGTTRSTLGVLASINPNDGTQVTFTSVLAYTDPSNGYSLSEMGLVMATGGLYSMTTFPDLSKTSSVQITINWVISYT